MRLEEIETGICKECGCTWTTPCVNEKFGVCWWMEDSNQDLCSHCYYGLNEEEIQL
ncbi:hypothetical protein FSLSAGS3026_00823 [Streptococcus agalactiae FSL S3-026]|nr:hypothetical protein FSLSAGS3026_10870 [Streptococcus agalactiae FSL S3-026]EGS28424.1 hypothetical protein FSLSAGS3026_00823 [Streptococcus agalactiae FSL S3-026]